MNKTETILKQHDEGYKSFFKDKKTFFEFLEEFVDKDWTKNLSENDWELIDKEFIDDNLKKRESDIVYKGKIDGEEVIVYILMELQSTVDQTMPIRLLFYMSEIWKSEFYSTNKNERIRTDYKLPPIIPMVLFNGKKAWNVSTSFSDKVMAHDISEEGQLDFKYILFNINKFDDIMLLNKDSIISKIFYLDKEKDIAEMGQRLLDLGNEWTRKITDHQQELFKTWLRVMLENNKQRIVDNTIKNVLEEINFRDGDSMVSNFGRNLIRYFEEAKREGLKQGREKGLEQGIEQGIQQGIEQGIEQEKVEIATNLLDVLEDETIAEKTGLDIERVKALRDEN